MNRILIKVVAGDANRLPDPHKKKLNIGTDGREYTIVAVYVFTTAHGAIGRSYRPKVKT